MQNPSISDNLTITKLLEVDADLAATEIELNAQLKSIQEKRHSLKTVIDLFAPADNATTTPVATPAQTPIDEVAIASSSSEADNTTTEVNPVAPQLQNQQAAKNSSPPSRKQGNKSTPIKKSSEQPNTWQKYVKDEFSNASLSIAVSEVMQQSEQVLEIANILDTIFTSEIPSAVRSTARERVSNVLSVGAKAGKWYRGAAGKYLVHHLLGRRFFPKHPSAVWRRR